MTRTSAEKLLKVYVRANDIDKGDYSSLKSLAKIPTKKRIPKLVILAVGGWGKDAPQSTDKIVEKSEPRVASWDDYLS